MLQSEMFIQARHSAPNPQMASSRTLPSLANSQCSNVISVHPEEKQSQLLNCLRHKNLTLMASNLSSFCIIIRRQ